MKSDLASLASPRLVVWSLHRSVVPRGKKWAPGCVGHPGTQTDRQAGARWRLRLETRLYRPPLLSVRMCVCACVWVCVLSQTPPSLQTPSRRGVTDVHQYARQAQTQAGPFSPISELLLQTLPRGNGPPLRSFRFPLRCTDRPRLHWHWHWTRLDTDIDTDNRSE